MKEFIYDYLLFLLDFKKFYLNYEAATQIPFLTITFAILFTLGVRYFHKNEYKKHTFKIWVGNFLIFFMLSQTWFFLYYIADRREEVAYLLDYNATAVEGCPSLDSKAYLFQTDEMFFYTCYFGASSALTYNSLHTVTNQSFLKELRGNDKDGYSAVEKAYNLTYDGKSFEFKDDFVPMGIKSLDNLRKLYQEDPLTTKSQLLAIPYNSDNGIQIRCDNGSVRAVYLHNTPLLPSLISSFL